MASIEMMKKKWSSFFKLMDIDKDGILSSKDRDACLKGFSDIYKPEGESAMRLQSDLDAHWNNLLFPGQAPDWSQQITEDQFVANMASLFENNKQSVTERVSTALKHLLSAADHDKNGIFTFDKFLKFHTAFNISHEDVVRITFDLIGPNPDDTCTFDEVHGFYVELFVGENKEKYATVKDAYGDTGAFLHKQICAQ